MRQYLSLNFKSYLVCSPSTVNSISWSALWIVTSCQSRSSNLWPRGLLTSDSPVPKLMWTWRRKKYCYTCKIFIFKRSCLYYGWQATKAFIYFSSCVLWYFAADWIPNLNTYPFKGILTVVCSYSLWNCSSLFHLEGASNSFWEFFRCEIVFLPLTLGCLSPNTRQDNIPKLFYKNRGEGEEMARSFMAFDPFSLSEDKSS